MSIRNPARDILELLILQLLYNTPMHGYKLMKKLGEFFGHPISPGTLYPLLRELLEKGEVEVRIGRRGGKVVKTYYITDLGKKILRENSERVEKVMRFVRGLKEFREAGGEELREFLEEVLRKMPEIDEEKKRLIREVTRECLEKYRRILGL